MKHKHILMYCHNVCITCVIDELRFDVFQLSIISPYSEFEISSFSLSKIIISNYFIPDDQYETFLLPPDLFIFDEKQVLNYTIVTFISKLIFSCTIRL